MTDFYELNQAILKIKPDAIIHSAAQTDVDACETQMLEAMSVNAGGTYGLGQVYPGKIVYISTDYVFDGQMGPYTEMDAPNPINVYGWSKLGGELALRNRGKTNDLIIRTTCLYDRDSANFITKIAKTLLAGKRVSVPITLYGNPTYIPHFAEAVLEATRQDISGVLNIAGDQVVSRFELAWNIGRILGVPNNSLIFAGHVYGNAPRPLNAGLITDKAKKLNLPLYSPTEGLEDALETMETRRPAYH
ncbi:MAG: SDR family oxidoreductase [Gammaproteobacteria bacterium]|nr:SDR family oxidoreductase [Gammaproteobacteria bacterium]